MNAGLNKGEARNALARAPFINRLVEIRDHSYEQQRFRASGLTLLTAAIALWNTVYLERAVAALAASGHEIDEELLPYLSPLGWGHINLTGDYVWKRGRKAAKGRFRPLRPFRAPERTILSVNAELGIIPFSEGTPFRPCAGRLGWRSSWGH